MLNTNLREYNFSQAEFGLMSEVYEELPKVKTKKAEDKLLRMIKNYLKSISSVRGYSNFPKEFTIFSIKKVVQLNEFPSEVYYTITISE